MCGQLLLEVTNPFNAGTVCQNNRLYLLSQLEFILDMVRIGFAQSPEVSGFLAIIRAWAGAFASFGRM